MSYPEKRGSKTTGAWYGEVDRRKQGGERYRRKFASKAEADFYETYIRTFGKEPVTGANGELLEPTGPTFADVLVQCRAAGGPGRAKWKNERDHALAQRLDYLKERLGHLPIAGVTTSSLDAIVSDLRKRPGNKGQKLSPGTINRYLTAASAVLRFAVERKIVPTMPKVPWQEEGARRTDVLSEEMEDAVCRVLTDMGFPLDALCIRVLAETGMRLGELYSLEPAQIEDARNENAGEGPFTNSDQLAWIRLWETKTNKPRSVPISPGLARSLRAMLAGDGLPNSFRLRERFHSACEKCGYSDSLTLHTLRHTTATRWLRKTGSRDLVMKLLGHKAYATTERYVHLADDDLAQAAKKVSPRRGETVENEGSAEIVPLRKPA